MSAGAMQWYRSKVDWWLALILCVPPVASIAVVASGLPWGVASGLFVLGLYAGLIFPMRYGVDDTELLVRFGLCRRRIPLASISEVRPTRNPLSSPALSLDRLHVQFGDGIFSEVMISPADRNGFLDAIARKAGLKREGDRLVRL
ncbi:MAG TPA: PH domain-containing protein [Thermoanaerobaculia bacterium]